jgi:hypothetical protein
LLAAALAIRGPRLGTGRPGAAVAALGCALGLFATSEWNHRFAVDQGRALGTYGFYSFYVQSPLLVRAYGLLQDRDAPMDEYGRYVQSSRILGSFDEHGGSLLRALSSNPVEAVLWLLLKPIDFLARLLEPDSFTPLALVAFVLAFRRARREGLRRWGARWAPLLFAFGAPLALLLETADQVHHLLAVAPLLILWALWGLEPWLEAMPIARGRRLGWAFGVAGAGAVLLWGHLDTFATPAMQQAGRWLERHCQSGCLANSTFLAVDALVWADLQAGAPMPVKIRRSEPFIFHRYPPDFLEGVGLGRRIAAARQGGWRGPILYVGLPSEPFDRHTDPEHWNEGRPDLAGATPLATFRNAAGAAEVEIFELSPSVVVR